MAQSNCFLHANLFSQANSSTIPMPPNPSDRVDDGADKGPACSELTDNDNEIFRGWTSDLEEDDAMEPLLDAEGEDELTDAPYKRVRRQLNVPVLVACEQARQLRLEQLNQALTDIKKLSISRALLTGIPRVRFSHTVPEPARNRVPSTGYGYIPTRNFRGLPGNPRYTYYPRLFFMYYWFEHLYYKLLYIYNV